MADIFLSYAREDTDTAKVLAESLAGHGWSVWWDRKILPGVPFASMIEHELNAAKCVIALWSNASVNSDWCKNEADVACKRGVLVPALLEADVEIPLAFRHLQAADITDFTTTSSHPGLEQLTKALALLVASRGAEQPAREERARRTRPRSTLFWRALTPNARRVVVIVVAAGAVLGVVLWQWPDPVRYVRGQVEDSMGHPVVDAVVTIDATDFSTKSHEDGSFNAILPASYPAQRYTLRIQHGNQRYSHSYSADSLTGNSLFITLPPP